MEGTVDSNSFTSHFFNRVANPKTVADANLKLTFPRVFIYFDMAVGDLFIYLFDMAVADANLKLTFPRVFIYLFI